MLRCNAKRHWCDRCPPPPRQVLLLENVATAVKAGPQQLPSVHSLLLEACTVLQMEAPELYVRWGRMAGRRSCTVCSVRCAVCAA